MARAHERAYSEPKVSPEGLVYHDEEDFENYWHHRDWLVEWGAIRKFDYEFENVLVPTLRLREVSRLMLTGKCPAHLDFESDYPESQEPMKLTIWCRPGDVDAWNEFLNEQDTSEP